MSEAGMLMTKNFEGWRDKPYKDTTGNMTIGWGFNMSDPTVKAMLPKGNAALDKKLAQEIFAKRYQQAVNDAISYLGPDAYNSLNEGRRNVINDMSYNLGAVRLAEFKKMREALLRRDYAGAANEMKNSKWFNQVGRRGRNHFLQIQED